MELNKIPKIREGVVDGFYADITRDVHKGEITPDIEFLEYTMKENPELLKNIHTFIKLIGRIRTHTNNTTYKVMMACLISSLKAVNAELEIREIE